jgi:hypothetical protein
MVRFDPDIGPEDELVLRLGTYVSGTTRGAARGPTP